MIVIPEIDILKNSYGMNSQIGNLNLENTMPFEKKLYDFAYEVS